MNILLLIILIAYQTYDAMVTVHDAKRFKGVTVTEKGRIKIYKEVVIWGCVPVGIIFMFSLFSEVSSSNIGFRRITLSEFTWLNITVFLLLGSLFLVKIYSVIMYFVSEEFKKKLAAELERDSAMENLMIPRTTKEKKYWFLVSLTAGIGEEIYSRGCVMFLLADIFPDMHIAFIVIMSSVLFGLWHAYQGLSGIILTSVMGLLFAGLYIATDSIVPGIILHFLWDFAGAFVLKRE